VQRGKKSLFLYRAGPAVKKTYFDAGGGTEMSSPVLFIGIALIGQ